MTVLWMALYTLYTFIKEIQDSLLTKFKIILTCSIQGVVWCPVPQGPIMNAQYYVIFAFYVCLAGRRWRPELVENAIIVHDNAIVHSADIVKNFLWHWGGMFYSTFPILLASIHVIMIWFSNQSGQCMGNDLHTQRGHFKSILELGGTD
jgi:hypothetical protein